VTEKKNKVEVNYSLGHKNSHCGRVSNDDKGYCTHFEGPASCELVGGEIRRAYWCELFEKAK
jgi:hypothetical protein